MKSCAKYYGWYTCSLEQHPKSDGQVEDKGEPVNDQNVRLFGGQEYSAKEHHFCHIEFNVFMQRDSFSSYECHPLERVKDPMPREIRHGVAFQPLSARFFQAGQEVQREELKF